MVDHVTVKLDFLVSQIGIVHSKIGDPDWRNLYKNVMRFGFRIVPNFPIDEVESLKASGVAYDCYWDGGSYFNSGGHSTRFSPDGELIYKVIKDADERQCILPWDNQEEYGKLYMARQLVAPKKG